MDLQGLAVCGWGVSGLLLEHFRESLQGSKSGLKSNVGEGQCMVGHEEFGTADTLAHQIFGYGCACDAPEGFGQIGLAVANGSCQILQ